MNKSQRQFIQSYLAIAILALLISHTASQIKFLSTASFTQPTNAFFPGGIIDSAPKNEDTSQYLGTISITLDSGQNALINFWAYFTPIKTGCSFKKCFIGWIGKYKGSDGQNIEGYPAGTNNIQPIFQFDTNSDTDYSISYSDSLDSVWSSLIDYACQKFNPFDGDPSTSTKFKFDSANNNLRGAKSTSGSLGTSTTDLKIDNISFKQSLLKQTILLDLQNNLLSKRAQEFNLQLATDKSALESGQIPLFKAKIGTTLSFSKKLGDAKLTSDALKFIKDSNKNIKIFSKNLIQNKRQTKSNGDPTFISIDKEPKIQTFDQKTILPGQIKASINIAQQFEKRSDEILQIKPGTQQNNFSFDLNQPISHTNIQLQSNAKLTKLSTTQTLEANKLSASPGLFLFPIIKNLLSYTKTLYSKTILGQTVSLQIFAYCQLYIYPFGAFVHCKADLIYNIFGNSKTLTIYNFIKALNTFWSWNNNYSGQWNFFVPLNFPPPFSYASLNFYIQMNYYFNCSLSITQISSNPYTIKFQGLVQAGLNTDSKATIKVVIVELGAYIKGLLLSVGTDPTLTVKFLFSQQQLVLIIEWYFWLNAFQFQWGFQWRRKKLFGGWTAWQTIQKWNVNGIYNKYTILNNTYVIPI